MPNLSFKNRPTSVMGGAKNIIGSTPIIKDNLVLRQEYNNNEVIPISAGAASFDGSSNYINCKSDSSIDMGTSAFSVTCWAYMNVIENLCLVAKGPSITTADSGWAISVLGSNGRVYLDINNSGRDANYTNTGAVTANKWYHIAVVVPASGGAGRKIYINGVDDTHTEDHEITDVGDAGIDLWFGDVPTGGTRELDGYMCNVGIWKGRVLTQPEIKSVMNKSYNELTASEKVDLAGWWNLDNASFPTANTNFFSGKTGALYYSDGVTGSGLASNTSLVDFVTTNGDELGDDIFGGKGSFDDSSIGYWGTNQSTIRRGQFLSAKTGYNALNKASILEEDKIYKLSFDIIDFTNKGNLQLKFNWNQSDPATDAYPNIWKAEDGTGSFYIYFKPGGGTRSTFTIYVSDTDTDGAGPDTSYGELTLDNVVVQEVKNAGELK